MEFDLSNLFNLLRPFAITCLFYYQIMKGEMTHFSRLQLFVNMSTTNEDKIIIKNLFV